ncbi:MAG: hypothetical protein ACOYEV_16305 [Candidatus Nanopelagicales bacterium]
MTDMSDGPDRTLIIEVSVGDDAYSYQLGTDRVWQDDREGAMRELAQPAPALRACLRMEALRRYLDLPVAEDLLSWQARDLWQRHFPGQPVTAWSMSLIAPEPALPEEPFARAAELVKRFPNHPAVAHLIDPTLHSDPDIGAVPPTIGEPGAADWAAARWCDVDTIPPRTLAIGRLPSVNVWARHEQESEHTDDSEYSLGDEHVEVAAAAFGPPGRTPTGTNLITTIWDTDANEVLANVVLAYESVKHEFRGCGPRMPGDYRIDGLGVAPGIELDISAVEQLHPVARDSQHKHAWAKWWAFNNHRRELVRRFLSDGSTAGSLTLAEQVWAFNQEPISVDILEKDGWLLGVVEVTIPGVGEAYFSPCHPAIDSGLRGSDNEALRRVAVVEYFAAERELAAGDESKAWDIDKGLAYAAAGDLSTAARYLQEPGEWLNLLGQQTADRAPSQYILDELGKCCRDAAAYVTSPLSESLLGTASTLAANTPVMVDHVDLGVPILGVGPIARGLPKLRSLARSVWLARRKERAEELALGGSLGPTQRATQQKVRLLKRSTAPGSSWDIAAVPGGKTELAALEQYPPRGAVADRPLLAELLTFLEQD